MKNTDPVECTWALGDNLSEVSPLRRSSESSHNKGNHKRSKIVGTHYSFSKQLYLCLEGSRARQGSSKGLTTWRLKPMIFVAVRDHYKVSAVSNVYTKELSRTFTSPIEYLSE